MEEFVQTSRNSGRTQTDQQTPPESLPISGDSRLIADVKREHEGCAAVAPCKSQRTSCNAIDPTIALDDTQRKVLEELLTCVDANASIVISDARAKGAARPCSGWRLVRRSPTAPPAPAPALALAPPPAPAPALAPPHARCDAVADNPIVYVTEPWETMCGFTYKEASGQNPRIVQGEQTDQKVTSAIGGALANQSACKVQLVNYWRGAAAQRLYPYYYPYP